MGQNQVKSKTKNQIWILPQIFVSGLLARSWPLKAKSDLDLSQGFISGF
jgi:hypothetical protein